MKDAWLGKVRLTFNRAYPMQEYAESSSALAIGKLLTLAPIVLLVADMLI